MSLFCYSSSKPAVPAKPDEPKADKLADLDIGKLDSIGQRLICFYGRNRSAFAVYRTLERVSVHFADDKAEGDSQRKLIAPLNPVRGEINGLLDGWRKPRSWQFARATRFDRRVGDALVVAFEDDVPDAGVLLARIKQDILDERIATARFEYLIAALFAGLAMVALSRGLTPGPVPAATPPATPGTNSDPLWMAAAAGAAGAFFSIAIGIRNRTVLPNLLWLANTMDAVLRMIIGVIGAAVLMTFIDLGLFKLSFGGSVDIGPVGTATNDWLKVLLVGFVAGFSERLVPDLLAKAAAKPDDPPPLRREADKQPAAGRSNKGGADGQGAATGADPMPEEAATDHCLCDVDHGGAATDDKDLPAASGGVAPAEPEDATP